MGSWLTFTALIGVAVPSVPRLILHIRTTFGFIQFFADGDLFFASSVIAADAIGRYVRFTWLAGRRRVALWAQSGLIASGICLWFLGQYSIAVVLARSSILSSQMPAFGRSSVIWYLATLIAAGVTIAGTEALRPS